MKHLFEQIKSFLAKQEKFFRLLFALLLFDYVLLFAAESILPGLVMRFFNLNIFLAVIIALWLLLVFSGQDNFAENKKIFNLILIFSGLALLAALLFAFLGINFLEMGVYFVLIALSAYLAYKLIE